MNTQEHFQQIQAVLNKITEDKELSQKFTKLESLDTKFNFTLEVCKEKSLDADYTIDEFKSFQFLVSALVELENNDDMKKKFHHAKNADEIYDLIINWIKEKEYPIKISNDEFKTFLKSVSSKKKIPPEDLEHVTGGRNDKTAIEEFVTTESTYMLLFAFGKRIGKIISDTVSEIKDIINQ